MGVPCSLPLLGFGSSPSIPVSFVNQTPVLTFTFRRLCPFPDGSATFSNVSGLVSPAGSPPPGDSPPQMYCCFLKQNHQLCLPGKSQYTGGWIALPFMSEQVEWRRIRAQSFQKHTPVGEDNGSSIRRSWILGEINILSSVMTSSSQLPHKEVLRTRNCPQKMSILWSSLPKYYTPETCTIKEGWNYSWNISCVLLKLFGPNS